VFRAWELSPGAYNTLPIRGPTTIRTVFMVADDNLAISIRQPAKCKSIYVIALKTVFSGTHDKESGNWHNQVSSS
jgi:ABC-type transporter lipoprotein component MlaA